MSEIIGEIEKKVCETCKGVFETLEKIKIEYKKHEMPEKNQREFLDEINRRFDKYSVSTKDRTMIIGLGFKLGLSYLK